VHSVSINLEATQFLAGWRPEVRTIFLPTLSEARVGESAAVRVGIFGQAIRATIFGKVSSVRRVGRPALPPGVEIHLDPASIPAVGFLAMAARGEPVTFRERAARYAVERRVTVEHASIPFETSTLNVSEGGCALRWTGALPLVGDVVQLELGSGLFSPTARAVVCWAQPGEEQEQAVGLRVIDTGRAGKAWRGLVAEIARAGGHAA